MSRINFLPPLLLQSSVKATLLSGCIASLLFPLMTPEQSLAATPAFDEIESSVVESSIPEEDFGASPQEDPGTFEGGTGSFEEDVRFSCANRGGQYTVMYQPESRPGEAFPWAVPQAMGGGWSPEARCFEIARRLEEYRPDGLVELQNGRENGYNILCVTTEDNPACRIVLTVPPGQNPTATRDAVFENLLVADTGEMTTGVTTYTGARESGLFGDLMQVGSRLFGRRSSQAVARQRSINLKPYLDGADRGTGTALNNGVSLQQTGGRTRLNPNRFRN
ncbi:COP23 domain-containing protein [Lyngbya confervoides]|uniref:COP23 domain-containing protein n=1 Tax=Lyngbya confervoides BDU141951 TaxID=1574623 RepID=A0ABD4T2R5_9CYAN|nr:COP23 domain-containing protein [Lyngbya confervoides]MCM1982708.1 COP23 domain-containing protein [Lyngbya confervoides BDU141951]